MFKSIKIKGVYRTRKDNVDTDLIIPLLRTAKKYDRGTGYFSILSMANLAEGLIPFIRNNGINTQIRIITSVELSPEDRLIIQKGDALAYEKTISELQNKIDEAIQDEVVAVNMDLLTNLIAARMVEIKIAYLNNGGIYHEKIALFEDGDGERVCLIGSQNETYSGYKKNVESISTLKSWREGDSEDISEQQDYFDDLWNGKDNDIEVVDFPEAQKQNLFTKYKYSMDVEHAIKRYENYSVSIYCPKKEKKLYKYQEDAIDEFVDNGYCHFYQMATGTGKTFTAVKSIDRIAEVHPQLYIAILVPQIDLQTQWESTLKEVGRECYLFGGLSKDNDWNDAFNRSIIDYYNEDKPVVSICIYDTFFSKIKDELVKAGVNVFIIVDEAHELSPNQINNLSDKFKYRLGLSATPERHNVDETQRIIRYFTHDMVVPYEYTIDEAIANDFLSHYQYYPLWVRMTEEEFEQYRNITQQIIILHNQDPIDRDAIKERLQARGVIVKKARNKIYELERLIEDHYEFTNSVVYCGQGKDPEVDDRIIDIVSRTLKDRGGYAVSQFTSRTENRKLVLSEFERGYYDTLVAIKCFDQGVDVPKLDKIYIMASDSLLRQTIQRRGRVLRTCTESGKTMAYIYDMVVLPPAGVVEGVGAGALVKNELRRVAEYIRLADNKEEFMADIEDLKTAFNISEVEDDEDE
ncbi:Superfamily II DNA or RNA helicase [Pseudobutyrivibrio ruminis]|uniref:Superfamily II DNA or RNA helicase n=1 Tax=Pseudobutyrivibrio ruminis TaxID=46206 RepID=A0A1H7F3M9_9FIRM|nr:DEAD/DEAH box helicase family protein [Pseudobutyrivibrio ruminis]SEK18620.1 Superfamily II DNA or RNA helicase [Pseudobutyrivibrio ruminis]